jgi:SAM-dependent methyltransferase
MNQDLSFTATSGILLKMHETSKAKAWWTELEHSVLQGQGIDIGCGPDPVTPSARSFDLVHGDANEIEKYVSQKFDFVYSSHCLEHMREPARALAGWWNLVKDHGHLFITVPDEDLYEQGVFPSRFNDDHKATFTISKTTSWSPKSVNILDLVAGLPGCKIVKIALQDRNYDRSLVKWNKRGLLLGRNFVFQQYIRWQWHFGRSRFIERLIQLFWIIDQTWVLNAQAQIQVILKKTSN